MKTVRRVSLSLVFAAALAAAASFIPVMANSSSPAPTMPSLMVDSSMPPPPMPFVSA